MIPKAESLEMNFRQAAVGKSIVYVTHRRCLVLVSAQPFQGPWSTACNKVCDTQRRLQSRLPNRLSAGSMLLGLLVAAITITCARCFSPSIRVNSWDTMRRSTSPCVCTDRKSWLDKGVYSTGASTAPEGRDTAAVNCIWFFSHPAEIRH